MLGNWYSRVVGSVFRSAALGMAIATAIVLSGCNPAFVEQVSAGEPRLVGSFFSEPKTFNAILSQQSPNIFGYVYQGLVEQNPLTGEIVPALAESWEISEDGKQIVFTLRENLKWSDGEPLTAEDVVFTFNDLILNPEIPSNQRDGFRVGDRGEFPTVRQLDERRIEVKVPEPFAPFLLSMGASILPAHALRKSVETKEPDGTPEFVAKWGIDTPPEEIIVNGPYQLVDYKVGERLVFRRNPYYWQTDVQGEQLPHIGEVVLEIVENQDTALIEFRAGNLDSVSATPQSFSLLKKEEKRGKFTIYNGGAAYGQSYFGFNLNRGSRNGKPLVDPVKSRWFNLPDFRRAIAYGIDRQRMINNAFRGLGKVQNSHVSIPSPFYAEDLRSYDYDPDRARELLLAAGFRYNNAGELEDEFGNRVRFSLITNAENNLRVSLGVQIEQDLGKLGIKVDFQPIAFNALVDKLSNSLDWESHILGFTGGNEPHFGSNLWRTDGNLHTFNQAARPGQEPLVGRQVAEWEKEIERLYIQGASELDFEKRKEIYAQTQHIVQENLPYIHLVQPLSLAAVRDRVQGVEYSALGGAFWNLEELKLSS